MSHGVRDCHRAALRHGHHRELVEPGVVGDRLEVADPRLERKIPDVPIRQAMTAFVETYDRRNPP
jgi:hypothetical protein